MLQQRRNSRRFVLSELQTFGAEHKSLLLSPSSDADSAAADVDDYESSSTAAVDSDDAEDGFCIQLEPMEMILMKPSNHATTLQSKLSSFANLPLHDDRPPTKHEIAQWKSITNLKSSIT